MKLDPSERFAANVRAAIAAGGIRGGADDGDAGDTGDTGDANEASAEPKPDPEAAKAKAEADKARAELDAAKGRAADLEKQVASLKKTATKEQKEAVAALEKQLDDMRASIKKRDEDDKKRVEARLAKLPDASRKKLEAVKDDIPIAALEKLIDAEGATPALEQKSASETPPAPRGGPSRGEEQSDTVPRNVLNALRRAGRKNAADSLQGMEFVQADGGNHNKWMMPMDMLLDDAERRSRDRYSIEPPKGMALATKDVVLRGAALPGKSRQPSKGK